MAATVNEQVSMMADLANMTGGLHAFQVRQIHLWGMAWSAAAKKCALTWTMGEDGAPNEVLLICEYEPSLLEADAGLRLAALKKALTVVTKGWSVKIRLRKYGTVTEGDDDVDGDRKD